MTIVFQDRSGSVDAEVGFTLYSDRKGIYLKNVGGEWYRLGSYRFRRKRREIMSYIACLAEYGAYGYYMPLDYGWKPEYRLTSAVIDIGGENDDNNGESSL